MCAESAARNAAGTGRDTAALNTSIQAAKATYAEPVDEQLYSVKMRELRREIPFRCLYSRNIANLMMVGKHISATHVAGSSTKVMLNGGQHGVAVGSAAFLCKKYETTPRDVGREHIKELQDIVSQRGEYESTFRPSDAV